MSKQERLRAFRQRCEWAQEEVIDCGSMQAVTVHPFADEQERLRELELTPQRCVAMDAYLCDGLDQYFLQIWPESHDKAGRSGLYYRWKYEDEGGYCFAAVVPEQPITRTFFDSIVARLGELSRFSARPKALVRVPE